MTGVKYDSQAVIIVRNFGDLVVGAMSDVMTLSSGQIKAERTNIMSSHQKFNEIALRVDERVKAPKAREIQARIGDKSGKIREGLDRYLVLLDADQKEPAYWNALNEQIEFQKKASSQAGHGS